MDWPGNSLKISLCALYFDLQAEGIFTWAVLFRLTTNGTIFGIQCTCLYLVHLWCPGFEINLLFLVTKTGKVSKLVASFTLELFSQTLKSLYVRWITTSSASFLVLMGSLGIKSLLVLALHLVTFSAMLLVICLEFTDDFFFLCFPPGKSVHWYLRRLICAACRSSATCFIWCTVPLELSILFASWHILLAWNLSKSTLLSLIVLDTNSSSHRKSQKMCKILAVPGGYLARLTCACTVLYNSSTFVALSKACEEVKMGSHLIWLGLAKFLKLSPDCV